MRHTAVATAVLVALLAAGGCNRPTADTADQSASTDQDTLPAPVVEEPPVVLEDVMEGTPDYLVGISYQGDATRYPGLAKRLKAYADAARKELIESAQSRPRDEGASNAPYDLSLSFVEVLQTPDVVTYAADGSSYTGGAHGMPLLARFSWLPREQKILTAAELIPEAAGWNDVSAYAREQLLTELSQRIDADKPSAADRASMMRNAGRMIDDGTAAKAENFSEFEPLPGSGGKLAGLRFIFAPYQVGPYSDGVQSVDVPADVVLPHVAPGYRHLFEGGGG